MNLFRDKKVLPEFTGLQIQTAANVLPIPIGYGSPRIAGNLIYANGFRSSNVKTPSSGGKGLFGSTAPTTIQYNETFILALGEGPLTQPFLIFLNQAYYNALGALPDSSAVIFFDGSPGQTPWSAIVSQWPTDAFPYPDVAYLGFADYPIDSSATIPQFAFVCPANFAGDFPLNADVINGTVATCWDADPAQCFYDLLTNTRYGVGFPTSFIDSNSIFTSSDGFNPAVGDASLSSYCQAVGMGFSVQLNNPEAASSILDRWCTILTVAPVWTGTILKFIPYWDTFASENPNWSSIAGVAKKYFAPNVTVLFDLTDDDYKQADPTEDPLTLERIDIAEVKNVVKFDFKDRANQWSDNVAEAKDENYVQLYGQRSEDIQAAEEFTKNVYAQIGAQTRLQRNLAVRVRATFKLSWEFCILEPMDVISITDATLGLSRWPCRVVSISEDEKGILTIVAEEFPVGAASATAYPVEPSNPPVIIANATPPAVNTPIIFEPTSQMLAAEGTTSPQIVFGVSGSDVDWGGYNLWLSTDNVTYIAQSATNPVIGPSRMGETTAILAAFGGTNPDNIHTLSVDVSESGAVLNSVTSADAAAGLNLCVLVDVAGDIELLTFTTAALTGPFTYNLTGLYRGLYGTIACAHPIATQFLRVDDLALSLTLPPAFIGQTVFAKFQSLNSFLMEPQSLASCTAYSYTPVNSGITPATSPILASLLAGSPVDLGVTGSTVTDALDLDSGGPPGPCAAVLYTIDLGAF